MLTPLLLALTLAGQQNESLLAQKGMTYTGKNGYEEFLLAADIARGEEWGTYLAFSSAIPHLNHLQESLPLNAEKGDSGGYLRSPLTERLHPMTPLAVGREFVDRYSRLFLLVSDGLRKPVDFKNSAWDFDTTFPELAYFRNIAKAETVRADVAFADGKSEAAVAAWIESLEFSDRIGRGGSLIHALVGIACQSIVLANAQRHLGELSVSDCARLGECSLQLLKREPKVAVGLRSEQRVFGSIKTDELAKLMTMLNGDDNEVLLSQTAWEKMSRQQQTQLGNDVRDSIQSITQATIDKLSKPEAAWVRESPDSKPAKLADKIAGQFVGSFPQVLSSEAKARTQVRLLRLHCLIQRYWHEWGMYPVDLKPFPANEWHDPASGVNFEYARLGQGYELSSKGWGAVGRIHLRYRIATGSGESGEGTAPPPPGD